MGRVLAIDYGDQRIGLALSDPLKIIASPYKTIVNNLWVLENQPPMIFYKKLTRITLPSALKMNLYEGQF